MITQSLPKKWHQVYPYGTQAGEEELRYFKAIARNPSYAMRSLDAISKESGLPIKRVEEITSKYASFNPPLVIQSKKNPALWGYWERNLKDIDKTETSLVQKDVEKRLERL